MYRNVLLCITVLLTGKALGQTVDYCSTTDGGKPFIPDDGCYPYYYQCVGDTVTQSPCPGGLAFNSANNECNRRENIEACKVAGTQKSPVICKHSDDGTEEQHSNCDSNTMSSKKVQACNEEPCPTPKWNHGRWSKCTAENGRGRQMRPVFCMMHDSRRSNQCPNRLRPPNSRSCQVTFEMSSDSPVEAEVCLDDLKIAYCPLVRKFKFCNRAYFRKMCCQTCAQMGFWG